MAVTQRLEFRQTQSLVMTPQLQQAIKLLQLTNLELSAFVEGELEQNPLLERSDGGAEATSTADEGADPDAEGEGEGSLDFTAAETPPVREQAADEQAWEWSSAPAQFETRGGRGAALDGEISLEQRLSEEPSLRDRLLEQLHMDLDDPIDRIIGIHLIDQLDEAGYLMADLPALAELLGCEVARIEATLARMQGFEPTGIFARDLRECLSLQLAERDRLDPAMAALMDNLDLLAKRDKAQLKRRCGIDDEDLADMVAEIRALNPKPALSFDHQVAQPVVPDVLVRPHQGTGWLVELNNDTLPRVLVNQHYYTRVSAGVRSKREREYLREHYQSANWLIKALHQRATTILKVAEEIVRQQEDFLNRGLQHLRPLTLRQVAEAIEMHESTVSRVTSNKYMSTPRGIYELKYFFTSSIAGTGDGVTHAAESVRQRIKELIDAEATDGVLSDDGLVARLRDEGIDIARRTVAKYREALHIPSSVQRRRDKAMSL
jgi:RNA polymerase sigma-54 factor